MDVQTRKPDSDLLSQEEIGRLLTEVAVEANRVTILKVDGTKECSPGENLRLHSFGDSSLEPSPQWRKMRSEHEQFARELSNSFSNHLRLDIPIRLARVTTISCDAFARKLGDPTHLTLFRIEPLRGMGMIDMPAHLGLAFVERMTGGAGTISGVGRELTEVEVALLDHLQTMLLESWCGRWKTPPELRASIVGHETNGRYLRFASPEAALAVFTFEIQLGGYIETFALALPVASLEPLLKQLAPPSEVNASENPRTPSVKPGWNPAFAGIEVPLTAEWAGCQVPARRITQLKVGDVLDFDADMAGRVVVRLASTGKFTGRLGMKNGKWAVQITTVNSEKAA